MYLASISCSHGFLPLVLAYGLKRYYLPLIVEISIVALVIGSG
jgi:hypothetical protein